MSANKSPNKAKAQPAITVRPLDGSQTLSESASSALVGLWDELRSTAVEAAQAPTPNIWAFQEQCFYFATIHLDDEKALHDISVPMQRAPSASPSPLVQATQRRADFLDLSKEIIDITPRNTDTDANPAPGHSSYWIDEDNPSHRMTSSYRAFLSDESSSNDPSEIRSVAGPTEQGEKLGAAAEEEQLDSHSEAETDEIDGLERLSYNYRSYAYDLPEVCNLIGVIYLTPSAQDAIAPGEVNLGLILQPQYRGQGYGPQAILKVLEWVFDDLKFHRVQAVIMESPWRAIALRMFTRLGFAHEGTRRRAIVAPATGTWNDATYLALLDTEWTMRSSFVTRTAPKSLWDEMFERHQREREELLRWDESRIKKKTASMETIRTRTAEKPSVLATAAAEKAPAGTVDANLTTGQTLEYAALETVIRRGASRSIFTTPPPSSDSGSEYDYNFSETSSDDGRFAEPALMDVSALDFPGRASSLRDLFGHSSVRDDSSASAPSAPLSSVSESEADADPLFLRAPKKRRTSAARGAPGKAGSDSDSNSNWDMLDSTSEASGSLWSGTEDEI